MTHLITDRYNCPVFHRLCAEKNKADVLPEAETLKWRCLLWSIRVARARHIEHHTDFRVFFELNKIQLTVAPSKRAYGTSLLNFDATKKSEKSL
jgi:hypothetical protein